MAPSLEPQQRLGEFILTNLEAILAAWEDFARTFWPGPQADSAILRNDAELMLRAVVEDMGTSQTLVEQKTKSEGRGRGDPSGMNSASLGHALARVNDGFDIGMMVAEFRALRASVFRIWWETKPVPHPQQIEDMGRFNEALDQLIAGSVVAFTRRVDTSRQLFLSMLGHDLRQPLGSLRMLTDVVAKPERLPSGPAPVTATMRECCDAMARMMDDLLDFTTTQRGESIPVTTAPTDLRTICEELLKEMQALHPDRSFALKAEGNTEGVWDPGRIRQLVSNLLANAVQHGCLIAPITTSLHRSGSEMILEVHNMGDPIPATALGTLFNPMVRIQRRDRDKPRGSMGLGLYICRQISLAHGGQIDVESTADGGTSFRVTLPGRSPSKASTRERWESAL